MESNFILGIISGVIGTLIAGLIAIIIPPIRKKFKEIWDFYKWMREIGLRLLLPLDKFAPLGVFEKMIAEGKGGDEVLVVGRTIRWLIERKRNEVIEGLRQGLGFRILILSPEKVENDMIDMRPLQLSNPDQIKNDLAVSVSCIKSICDEAALQKFSGSFEVKTCDYVIFNSLVSFTSGLRRRIILDFSFSEILADKYQQYYECDSGRDEHFCNKLYKFYEGFYNQGKFYMGYSQEQGKKLSQEFVGSAVKRNISLLIGEYSESEEIRQNEPKNYLFAVPGVFNVVKNNLVSPPPMSVQVELTNKCNNTNCIHCKRHTWPSVGEMSTKDVKNLISELVRLRVRTVTLSGGEPTLRTDFVDILQHAHNEGLKTSVLTNGLNIDYDLACALTKFSDWVRVSLDGSNETVYERIRRTKGGFGKVQQSITNLEKAKSNNNEKCEIGICYTIQRWNMDDVPSMIDFIRGLNLSTKGKTLTFKFAHGRDGEFLCDITEFREFCDHVFAIGDNTWNTVTNLQYLKRFVHNYSNAEDIANGMPLNSYFRTHQIRCFTPYLFSLIDAIGDVYPCCFLYYDNDAYEQFQEKRAGYKMGNVREQSFDTIWSGEAYMDIRNSLRVIDIRRFPECKECTRHYFHNVFLTQLFDIYESTIEEIGDQGSTLFGELMHQYPTQVVWL